MLESNKISYSYLPQYALLLSNLTINEHIKLYLKNSDSQKQFTNICNSLNFHKSFDLKVKLLSKGQKQKVAIALCLAQAADIYVLDEPLNYLDRKSKSKLNELINLKKRDSTIIIVDHEDKIDVDCKLHIKQFQSLQIEDERIAYSFKNSKIKVSLYEVFKNLSLNGKFFSIILMILIIFLSASVFNNNSLNSYTNSYVEYQVGDIDSLKYCPANTRPASLYQFDSALKTDIVNRLVFSNRQVKPVKRMVSVVNLKQPYDSISKYDGPIEYYNIERLLYGNLPRDNSNEVAIDHLVAKKIKELKYPSYNSIKQLIGESIEYNDEMYQISGIYVSQSKESASRIILGYDENDDDHCKITTNEQMSALMLLVVNIKKLIINSLIIVISITIGLLALTSFEYKRFKYYKQMHITNKLIYFYVIMTIMLIVLNCIYFWGAP